MTNIPSSRPHELVPDPDFSADAALQQELTAPASARAVTTIFNDLNQDGVNNDGALFTASVTVNLYWVGTDSQKGTGDDLLVSSITTTSGIADFDNIPQSTYYFEYVLPSGVTFTLQDVAAGGLGSDSDAGGNGISDIFTTVVGSPSPQTDAGVVVS